MADSTGSRAAATALAGGLAGAAQVLAEQPFDTIKTRLQSRSAAFVVADGPATLTRSTLALEGYGALLQGLTPRLFCYSLVKFSLFSLYERGRSDGGGLSVAAAGGLAGMVNTLVSCPQDVLKSRLQVQVVVRPDGEVYLGPLRMVRRLLARHGARAFYRGLPPLIVRDTIGYAVLFSIFESSMALGTLPTWLCGGLSGLGFYLTTLPVDRVKTVMMTQSFSTPQYENAWVCASSLLRTEGLAGAYRGCSPTLARTFVGQASCLSVFELVRGPLETTLIQCGWSYT